MNIVSMTGYGQGVALDDNLTVTIEIKTVNSRFLDLNIKTPREYSQFDIEIRRRLADVLKRGRCDVYVTKQFSSKTLDLVNFNRTLFDSFLSVFDELEQKLSSSGKMSTAREAFVRELLLKHEILSSGDSVSVSESEKKLVFLALERALNNLCDMRQQEGERLAQSLSELIDDLRINREKIAEKVFERAELYKDKLTERLKKLISDVDLDPQRIAMEVAIIADKFDVTEEVFRLKSHFEQFDMYCEHSPNGRALDFLIQECGREYNTISSKIQDADVQALVVSAKACLEKLREQVQNIE